MELSQNLTSLPYKFYIVADDIEIYSYATTKVKDLLINCFPYVNHYINKGYIFYAKFNDEIICENFTTENLKMLINKTKKEMED